MQMEKKQGGTYDEGEVGQVEEGDAHGEGDVQADVQSDVVRHQVVLQVPTDVRTYVCVCVRERGFCE